MNLRQWIKYLVWRDTTFRGEFRAILRHLREDSPKVVVDVGANNGFYASNSFPFVARGWRAVLIEPDPRAFALLQRRFQGRPAVTCLPIACGGKEDSLSLRLGAFTTHSTLHAERREECHGAQTGETVQVRVRTLAAVLAELGLPRRYGVLSIDTEGFDHDVLQGADLDAWRPDVIFTENFAPNESPKREFLRQKRYELRDEVDNNTVWTPVGRPDGILSK